MLRLLALFSVVPMLGCGMTVDRGVSGSKPAANAYVMDGGASSTRLAPQAWVAHEIAVIFEKENAAAQVAQEHPSF